jgi:hypothetical protein
MRRYASTSERSGSAGAPHTFFVSLDAVDHADLLRLEEAAKPIIGSVRLPSGAVGG